jgi:hypothetical protein
MAIECDNAEERQARVDEMIHEFQEARRRRLAQSSSAPGSANPDIATEPAVVTCHEPVDDGDA